MFDCTSLVNVVPLTEAIVAGTPAPCSLTGSKGDDCCTFMIIVVLLFSDPFPLI